MTKSDNLLIDCSYIDESIISSDSLGIYAIRMIKGFLKYGHYKVYVLLWRGMEDIFDRVVGENVDKIVLDRCDLLTNWPPYYKLSGTLPGRLKQEIENRNISVVINPVHHNTLFFYPQPIRQYSIVHDLFIFDYAKTRFDYAKTRKGKICYYLWHKYQIQLMKKYTGLISISQNTHDDLKVREGFESEVVYNSISFNFAIGKQPIESVRGKKYILDINRFSESKNAGTLIRAFGLIKNTIPHILYLKGSQDSEDHRKALERLVADMGLEDRVVFDTDYRTEGEIRYLYTHADLFVSPSLKEGFGYTPIEAAILKTPVLVSNIDVFKEVTCGKFQTFDPYSPKELAKLIMELLMNPPSEEERKALSDFFMERYSLCNQIKQIEEIITR